MTGHAELEALAFVLRIAVAGILIFAGFSKVRDISGFEQALRGYEALPRWAVAIVARGLPPLEIAGGVALAAGLATRYVALSVGALFLSFVVWLTIALLRGLDVDCGCFSSTTPSRLTWWSVGRALALALVAAFVAFPETLLGVDVLLGSSNAVQVDLDSLVPAFVLVTSVGLLSAVLAAALALRREARL